MNLEFNVTKLTLKIMVHIGGSPVDKKQIVKWIEHHQVTFITLKIHCILQKNAFIILNVAVN